MRSSNFFIGLAIAMLSLGLAAAQTTQQPPVAKVSSPAKNLMKSYASDSKAIMELASQVAPAVSKSTVRIVRGRRDLALGVVVSADGHILTKAGHLKTGFQVILGDERFDAEIIGIHRPTDLAMLKINASDLQPVALVNLDEDELKHGRWLVSCGPNQDPVALGVFARIPVVPSAFMGVALKEEPINETETQVVISVVIDGSSAEKENLLVNDVIRSIDGLEVNSVAALKQHLSSKKPLDDVNLTVQRGEVEKSILLELGESQTNGSRRRRRQYFEHAIEHDSKLRSNQCGGPVTDLSGKIVGINVSEPWRTPPLGATPVTNLSLAIPVNHVIAILDPLKSGDLAPARMNRDRIQELERAAMELKASLTKLNDHRKKLVADWKELQDLRQRQENQEKMMISVRRDLQQMEKKLKKLETELKWLRTGIR